MTTRRRLYQSLTERPASALTSAAVGNRLWGAAARKGAPRWMKVLGYAVAVALALLAFYLAIRWSADLGGSEADG